MSGGFDAARALGAGLGDRRQAWEFIGRLAAGWTSPLAPGDGFSEDVLWAAGQRLGVQLPAALREAYLLFDRRCDLTAVQDPLVPPERLRVDHSGSIMVFRVENQHCAEWGVATALLIEDPQTKVQFPEGHLDQRQRPPGGGQQHRVLLPGLMPLRGQRQG